MKRAKGRRNPNDATLRNVRAANERIKALMRRMQRMEDNGRVLLGRIILLEKAAKR